LITGDKDAFFRGILFKSTFRKEAECGGVGPPELLYFMQLMGYSFKNLYMHSSNLVRKEDLVTYLFRTEG